MRCIIFHWHDFAVHGQTYTSAYCEDFFMYFKSSIRHSGNILAVYCRETVGIRSLNRTWNSVLFILKPSLKIRSLMLTKKSKENVFFFSVSCDIFAVFLFSLTLALTLGTSGANQDVKKRKILSNSIRSLKPFKKTVLGKR